jgi:hypothetical protein
MKTTKVRVQLDWSKLLAFSQVKDGGKAGSLKMPAMTMFGPKIGGKINR